MANTIWGTPGNTEDWAREFQSDKEFMAWLNATYPDWDSEYTGTIYGQFLAWKAGYAQGISDRIK
jgi:hypothetical protein